MTLFPSYLHRMYVRSLILRFLLLLEMLWRERRGDGGKLFCTRHCLLISASVFQGRTAWCFILIKVCLGPRKSSISFLQKSRARDLPSFVPAIVSTLFQHVTHYFHLLSHRLCSIIGNPISFNSHQSAQRPRPAVRSFQPKSEDCEAGT